MLMCFVLEFSGKYRFLLVQLSLGSLWRRKITAQPFLESLGQAKVILLKVFLNIQGSLKFSGRQSIIYRLFILMSTVLVLSSLTSW